MAPKALKLCFAFIRSVPVVFITAVIGWSYYAYVVQMCICTYNKLYFVLRLIVAVLKFGTVSDFPVYYYLRL